MLVANNFDFSIQKKKPNEKLKLYHSRDADMSIIETSIYCPQCLFLEHLLSANTWSLSSSSLQV